LYDKRDDFNFAIVNFPYTCSNILLSTAYMAYISLNWFDRQEPAPYDQFLSRGRLLIDKLMLQGFLQSPLMSAFCKFYGRHNDQIYDYKLSLSHICCLTFFIPIVRPHLTHWLWQRITPHSWSWKWPHGGCDRSTGDASPRHLTPPLVLPGVRVSLIFIVLWIASFIWSEFDCRFSPLLSDLTHWFWLRVFRLPIWTHQFLTNDFCIWNGANGGCNLTTGDTYSSEAPDPTSGISGGPC
jgi:hypothetical protein